MDFGQAGFWAKKIATALVLVPGGPLVAIAVGLRLAPKRPRRGLALAGLGTLVLVALSLPIIANGIARPFEVAYPPLDPSTVPSEGAAIVVFGGGVDYGALDYGGETVNAITLVRLRSAARLVRRSGLPVLVSGGRPPTARWAEADLMADALTELGVPVRWRERVALDTDDNARLSAAILKDAQVGTAVLVTDALHMRRAATALEAEGIAVVPAPTAYYATERLSVLSFLPSPGALRRSAWTVHEWVGVAWSTLTRSLRG